MDVKSCENAQQAWMISSRLLKVTENAASNDAADKWARDAVAAIIEKMGPTDIDVLKVANLLNALHHAGLHILEQEIDSMVKESFMECMA